MITETFKHLYKRDLQNLHTQIELYQDEKKLWIIDKNIANSGGNLCLHILGNLNAYIGVGLANTGYKRQRDLEFSLKNVPKKKLLEKIEDTIEVIEKGLDSLTMEKMKDDFPVLIWEKPTEMEWTLVHLLSHLNYHLGQINYHRRLIDKV